MKRIAALLAATLTGCATLTQPAALDAYKQCAVADVITTTAGLSMNVMHEGNPLTRALIIHSLGPVAGVVIPVIGLSIAGYYILQAINKPVLTAGVAGLTCISSMRNVGIIAGAK